MKELSTNEQKALQDCEHIIAVGMTNFREVGEALTRIRDERLYRVTHKSFEAYCKEKWDFGRIQAHRMIEANKVAKSVTKLVTEIEPERESQTRPLAALPESEQPAAWSEAVESAGGKQPTAKQVKEAVEKRTKPEPETKDPLEPKVREALNAAEMFGTIQKAITNIKRQVREIIDAGPLGRHINPQEIEANLTNAFRIMKFAAPFADCVYCGRMLKKTCNACKGYGWLTKDQFNMAPEDMRANSVIQKERGKCA